MSERTRRDVYNDMRRVAKRDFPHWFGEPFVLVGKGSAELDALAAERKALPDDEPSAEECEAFLERMDKLEE